MSNIIQELTKLIYQDLTNTDKLYAVLGQERELLSTRQFSQLPELVNQKQVLIDSIELTNKNKAKIVNELTTSRDPKEILNFLIAKFGQKPAQELKDLNNKLELQLKECRKLNSINGQVIVQSMRNNEQLVAIVTGNNTSAGNLYNSLGKVDNKSCNKSYHDKV